MRVAQEVLREHGPRPLSADKNLDEGGDGHELAREAMRVLLDLLVIYVSSRWAVLGDLTPSARERILPKSFTATRLLAVVQELTERLTELATPWPDHPFGSWPPGAASRLIVRAMAVTSASADRNRRRASPGRLPGTPALSAAAARS